MSNPLFNIRNGLFVIAFLLAVSVQAQQRDRLRKLDSADDVWVIEGR